ncbi:hypothetical protein K435DRAFT_970712 [Dendrothele bispora CBS 962.96]|uniref:Protein kinase domain-containing protein n=1 Tax=Dendrothele bispora (strain CBS 962.96) TaxID=1314807 RepID=A0A4S8LA27_DENBC|nr:hypothetical protein K435DRAFT_970712 [Dendrothele bispora CBS 962.96]
MQFRAFDRRVRQQTCIPVPFHQRYIPSTLSDAKFCLVMQYVQGSTVMKVWSSLSWWMKLRICATVRYYVYQLRRLCRNFGMVVPGPLGSEIGRSYCSGRLFTDGGVERRLVASYHDLCRCTQKGWNGCNFYGTLLSGRIQVFKLLIYLLLTRVVRLLLCIKTFIRTT